MADVTAYSEGEVATDGTYIACTFNARAYLMLKRILTRRGLERVGRAEHSAASLDSVKSLPDHGDDRARGHVLNEGGEEGLALEVSIVYTRPNEHKVQSAGARTYASQGARG